LHIQVIQRLMNPFNCLWRLAQFGGIWLPTTLEAKLARDQDTLIDFLKDETGRSVSGNQTYRSGLSRSGRGLFASGDLTATLQPLTPSGLRPKMTAK
jgi:hypothetical protein